MQTTFFHRSHSALRTPHSAFTLVELLVTITIIGIIAGLTLGAMQWARRVAAEAKTKATIAKLDNIVTQRYDSYRTRRVPIDINQLRAYIRANNIPRENQYIAQARLEALRDLMRMEMPERWSDVTNNPIAGIQEPAIKLAYKQRYYQVRDALVNGGMNIGDAEKKVAENGGPECLYLLVSMGSPDAIEKFRQDEIVDVDGDTLMEFADGWGTPISFLRWAPGFNDSDLQANINSSWDDPVAIQQRQIATTNDHDPFDPRKVDVYYVGAPSEPTGWRLVPLIYSAGPDKEFGLYDAIEYTYMGNPYETIIDPDTSETVGIGTPKDTGQHYDNIHNHRVETR